MNRIDLDADYWGNSNQVPGLVSYALLFNKPLPDALKNRIDKDLGSLLKFDENLKTGLTYRRYLKKIDAIISVGYNYRQMLDINAPKQAFETLFLSSSRYPGDTVNLTNVNYEFYNYNQFSAGIFKSINYGKYQIELGFQGSVLTAINQEQIQTAANTWLYTTPDGQLSTLSYNLTYNTANAGTPKFFGTSGFGGSGDFHFAVLNSDKWKCSIDVSDFGVMGFRKTPGTFDGSGVDTFQGPFVPELKYLGPNAYASNHVDSSAIIKLPGKSNNQYTVFLPFNAQIAFSKPLMHDRLVLTFGIQYREIPFYYACGYAKVNYFLKPDMVISGTLSAGGYSLFNAGFEFSKSWKYFDLTLGSSNLIGLIAPAYYPGTGLFVRLGTSF